MAIYTTYEQIGLAEDVKDDISMISPVDSPVASMSKNTQATARIHEFQEDELDAIKQNIHLEGSAAGTDNSVPTVMRSVNCQIFKETAEISRTAERVKKYGRASEMNYQTMKRKLAMIRDEESAIAGDAGGAGRQVGAAGAAGTERQLTSIYSQVDAANIVDATAGTTTVQLEGFMVDAMQTLFDGGGNGNYAVTDSLVAGYFPSFALSAGRNVDVVGGELFNYVDIYRSQFGSYDVVIDRSMTNTSHAILLMDFEFSETPILDPTQDYALAKDGDRERREIVRESTYALTNSKAAAIVDAIPATLI
jgi:hypothetical protein